MALAERSFVRDLSPQPRDGDVVLGDDWVTPETTAPDEVRARRERRGLFSLRASPLTRKIIFFNLIALFVLVAGILFLNSSRDSLAVQRAASLVIEAELIADVIEAQLPTELPVNLATGDGVDVGETLHFRPSRLFERLGRSQPKRLHARRGSGAPLQTRSQVLTSAA